MKTKSQILIIAAGIFLFSCSSYSKKKFGLERKFNFERKEDYKKYLINSGLFPLENVLYIDSSSTYRFFIDKLKKGQSVLYIGTFLNDSVSVKNSDLLEANASCKGRLEAEVSRNFSLIEYPDSLMKKETKMSEYTLYHLKDNKTFDINSNNKKCKVFLLYAYSFGTYYDSMYKEIMRAQKLHEKDAEVFVVIADPIQLLK